MKHQIFIPILTLTAVAQLHADNLIWSDNFNVDDSTLDGASLDGRLGGFLANDLVPRSENVQHAIRDQMLRVSGSVSGTGIGRVRFEVAPGGPNEVSYNFAAGNAAATILSGGGVRVEFDFIPANSTSGNGICFSTGFPASNILADPAGVRVAQVDTDFGILMGNNGTNRCFKNANSTVGVSYVPTVSGARHVVIDYSFTGLADGNPFTVVATIDGIQILNQSHVWSNNSGQLLMELGDAVDGTLIDNLQIFDKSPIRLGISLDNGLFKSALAKGADVGTLSALLGGVPGGATYQLVTGTGDTDNGKFQITGDKLEVGTYNFKGANSTEGQHFSVLVRGTSTGTGAQTADKVLVLTVTKDDDADGLPDAWEIAKAGNITSLKGNSVADFDGDGLIDLEEYKISIGASTLYPFTLPDINPTLADSDVDGLNDREELEPGYKLAGNQRPPTDPTVADTDGDGLSDFAESNTGVYVSPTNTGSTPTAVDSDFDSLGDGFETANHAAGYNPNVDDSNLDTDGDHLTTAQEVFYGTSVISTDTDGDGLTDDEEVFGTAGLRPPTDPTRVDSDYDGLSDYAESNTGVYVNGSNTGTNPALSDTDGDFIRDGVEIAAGTDPFSASSRPAPPASVKLVRLTDDASTGISPRKVYTHKISGGGPTVINGVNFNVLQVSTQLPVPNFTWEAFLNDANVVADRLTVDNNNGSWIPAEGGVSGTGLLSLFDSFCYAGSNSSVGSRQRYTLSGLTPGQTYDLRIYIRMWDSSPGSNGHPVDLVFTNGSQVVIPYQSLAEDRADVMLGDGNLHEAYYLNFHYVAQGTSLVVEGRVPMSNQVPSGTFHLYGMSNEVAVPSLGVKAVSRDAAGNIVIDFVGPLLGTFNVTKSPDLITAFGPLTPPLTATTDASGVGRVTIPASGASGAQGFFRLEGQ